MRPVSESRRRCAQHPRPKRSPPPAHREWQAKPVSVREVLAAHSPLKGEKTKSRARRMMQTYCVWNCPTSASRLSNRPITRVRCRDPIALWMPPHSIASLHDQGTRTARKGNPCEDNFAVSWHIPDLNLARMSSKVHGPAQIGFLWALRRVPKRQPRLSRATLPPVSCTMLLSMRRGCAGDRRASFGCVFQFHDRAKGNASYDRV